MSLIISCETKSNAWEGMSLASLSDWFQGFCVFLLRYSLKKQQPVFLMKVGWEEQEDLDLIMHFYGSLEEILPWKQAVLMWQVNQMWAVAVRRPKSSMKFWIHFSLKWEVSVQTLDLNPQFFWAPYFPVETFPSLLLRNEHRKRNGKQSFNCCLCGSSCSETQSELHSLCCQQSEQEKTILSLIANNFVYRLLSTLTVELKY